MFELGIDLDLSDLDRRIETAEARAKRLAPAFRDLRQPMRLDQREHAKNEAGPSAKWPPRSPMTEARRRQRNRGARTTKAMRLISVAKFRRRATPKKILGRLPSAIDIIVGSTSVTARSRVPWSAAHMKGGRVGRGSRLPKRVFLWLSDRLIEKAREVIAAHVMKGLVG